MVGKISIYFLLGPFLFLPFLLPTQAIDSCRSGDPDSCSVQRERSLLQVSAGRHGTPSAAETKTTTTTTRACLKSAQNKGSAIQTNGRGALPPVHKPTKKTTEKPPCFKTMPPELVELGTQLFGSKTAMEKVVAKSSCGPMTYANVSLRICIAAGDNAKGRLPEEDGEGYGLDTLKALRNKKGLINMLDFGGNYGVVTIATFKKYPGLVRSVVAEPVPSTFFFLRWNMYLNGVPMVDKTAFRNGGSEPGVVALNKAVSGTGGSVLRLCLEPGNSMNSYMSLDSKACKCYNAETPCAKVGIVSSDHMMSMFGSEDITLLKMDCEGCEKTSLPAIANGADAGRVKRLVGELHDPDPSLVQLACKYDRAKFMTAFCSRLVKEGVDGRVDGSDICARCTV